MFRNKLVTIIGLYKNKIYKAIVYEILCNEI